MVVSPTILLDERERLALDAQIPGRVMLEYHTPRFGKVGKGRVIMVHNDENIEEPYYVSWQKADSGELINRRNHRTLVPTNDDFNKRCDAWAKLKVESGT